MDTRSRLIATLTALLLLSSTASAGLFRTGKSVRIDADTSIEENLTVATSSLDVWGHVAGDIVAGCRSFVLEGIVDGDLFIAGQSIDLDGSQSGDALLFAQHIKIKDGTVEDIRAACQRLNVNAIVTGDILAAGQDITIDRDTRVGGDAALAAQTIEIYGTIKGKLVAGAQWIEIGGRVEGDADLYVDDLNFHGDGVIDGDLTVHYDDEKPEIDEGRVKGTVSYIQLSHEEYESSAWPWKVWSLLAAIVTGLLLVLVFGRCFAPDLEEGLAHPFRSMGYGFLAFAAVPVGILVSFLLVLTVPVGLILLAVYFPMLYVGWIIGGLLAGHMLLRSLTKADPSPYLSVTVGVLLLKVIGLIPFLGMVVGAAVALVGIGVIVLGSTRITRG